MEVSIEIQLDVLRRWAPGDAPTLIGVPEITVHEGIGSRLKYAVTAIEYKNNGKLRISQKNETGNGDEGVLIEVGRAV